MKKAISHYFLIIIVLMTILFDSCKKEKLPTVSTAEVTDITATIATCGGEIISEGTTKVTVRGVCWSLNQNPTILDNQTTDGEGTGSFTSNITGLTANTIYYVKAYATNSIGTAYGNELSFTTLTPTQVADIDGNIYELVTIGTQTWMKENLKTTKYNDGTALPNITDNTAWSALTTGAYSDYNNTPSNSSTYGRLYNWYAVDNNAATKVASNGGKNVCPTGWHVPSDTEWHSLILYLDQNAQDGSNHGNESLIAGSKLKETGTAHWQSPNTGVTNETGFTALPGGSRNSNGSYNTIGTFGNWWSSTEYSSTLAYFRCMYNINSTVSRYGLDKPYGFSVRCLRDN